MKKFILKRKNELKYKVFKMSVRVVHFFSFSFLKNILLMNKYELYTSFAILDRILRKNSYYYA